MEGLVFGGEQDAQVWAEVVGSEFCVCICLSIYLHRVFLSEAFLSEIFEINAMVPNHCFSWPWDTLEFLKGCWPAKCQVWRHLRKREAFSSGKRFY